jgi:hypothetical protein
MEALDYDILKELRELLSPQKWLMESTIGFDSPKFALRMGTQTICWSGNDFYYYPSYFSNKHVTFKTKEELVCYVNLVGNNE